MEGCSFFKARTNAFEAGKRHHDFARGVADTHLNMAKESSIGIFVIRRYAKFRHKVAYGKNNALCFTILNQAFARINNTMRSPFVHAAEHTAAASFFIVHAHKRRDHLVAIMARILHAHYFANAGLLV